MVRARLPGEIPEIHTLEHLGGQLIALPIARGMSQRELAQRLGVSEAVVSWDEYNECELAPTGRTRPAPPG